MAKFRQNKSRAPTVQEITHEWASLSKHPKIHDIFTQRLKMIKAARSITYTLGKLGMKCCIRANLAGDRFYGLGLKEAKDLVEGYIAKLDPAINWTVLQ